MTATYCEAYVYTVLLQTNIRILLSNFLTKSPANLDLHDRERQARTKWDAEGAAEMHPL